MKPGVGQRLTPVTLETLFRDFNTLQAMEGDARSIIIEDQTGLPAPAKGEQPVEGAVHGIDPTYLVATDSPYFRGAESVEMARRWYRDELGITFTETTRPLTVHVVRRKQQ